MQLFNLLKINLLQITQNYACLWVAVTPQRFTLRRRTNTHFFQPKLKVLCVTNKQQKA